MECLTSLQVRVWNHQINVVNVCKCSKPNFFSPSPILPYIGGTNHQKIILLGYIVRFTTLICLRDVHMVKCDIAKNHLRRLSLGYLRLIIWPFNKLPKGYPGSCVVYNPDRTVDIPYISIVHSIYTYMQIYNNIQ
jgi:hypothetical protein